MSQQINLYHPIFRKEKKKFSARAMAQAGGAIVAGVVVLYGFNAWQLRGLRAELKQAEAQQATAANRLDELTRRLGVKGGKSELARLRDEVTARERLRALLAQGGIGNSKGYSDFFVALARQHLNGLWLTRLDIGGGGDNMVLEGRSVLPDLVPRYMQRLSTERALAGRDFQVFRLARAGTKTHYVDFVVKSAPQTAEGVKP